MSDILNAAVTTLNEKLSGGFDGSVKFDIAGEGCVRVDENGASIDDGDADCTLKADADTFQGIMSGDTNPTAAFMTGKLKVEGDMGAAMKLGSLLS